MLRATEFFAGSGLVTEGLKNLCSVVWANDISPKKAAIYSANHGLEHFQLADISDICGETIPNADLSWASFPCQDLSLAGRMEGIDASRSGMFWQWLRVIDEMASRPKIVCLENVLGLVSTNGGSHYQALHNALAKRGYRIGPMMLDAVDWLPQSRRRIFVVGIQEGYDTVAFEDSGPNWAHSNGVIQAARELDHLVWWKLPRPKSKKRTLIDVIDWDAETFAHARTKALLDLIPDRHRELMDCMANSERAAFPGYRRTRSGQQVLELRFDNIAGCLRTAEGGSSRQFLILRQHGKWSARLLTPREAARLMGAPNSYKLSDNYNDSYSAIGDAVAVPVVRHLARSLLCPLAKTPKLTDDVRRQAPDFCLQP